MNFQWILIACVSYLSLPKIIEKCLQIKFEEANSI